MESIDELLRHGVQIPTLEDFEGVVLFLETCKEQPEAAYLLSDLFTRNTQGKKGAAAVDRTGAHSLPSIGSCR